MAAERQVDGAGQIPAEARLSEDSDWSAQAVDISSIGRPLERFSWLSPLTLWRSRNNVLASLTGDPTESARLAWVRSQRELLRSEGAPARVVDDFMIERDELEQFDFMVIGDTGEGDRSQYSVMPAFLSAAKGSEFAVIASDVIYPAGDARDYPKKFFIPFAHYPRPIYAIPGNHDWLDGLAGFMRHFCRATPPSEKFRPPRHARWPRGAMLIHNLFWRRPLRTDETVAAAGEELRGAAQRSGPAQPNMYFCIDTPKLRIIAIDTGTLGRLDHEQGQWLARMSQGGKPKLLISGKPIWLGNAISPRRVMDASGGSGHSALLRDIVTDPANNFLAVLAGDIHHYERHSVDVGGGRRLQSVITGGGGAFMSSTHEIEKISLAGVGEEDWVVYPTRGDSLRAYSMVLQRRLARVSGRARDRAPSGIPADEAAAIVAERHGLDLAAELARGEGAAASPGGAPIAVSRHSRRLAAWIYPRRAWFSPGKISEFLDWDDPPFFKNFMRVSVEAECVTLTAYGVTGLARDAERPAIIDRVVIELEAGKSDG